MYTVWAQDSTSTGGQCNYLGCKDAFFPAPTYTLTIKPCTSVTDSAAPGSSQLAGTSVMFTAAATGCPHPLYQFWIRPPGSSAWQVVQPYSSISTFDWSTVGLAAGTYLYTAWARDASSPGASCSYLGCNDAYFPAPAHTLTPPHCPPVSDSPAPASPP